MNTEKQYSFPSPKEALVLITIQKNPLHTAREIAGMANIPGGSIHSMVGSLRRRGFIHDIPQQDENPGVPPNLLKVTPAGRRASQAIARYMDAVDFAREMGYGL